jgi:hypothetical protein
MAGEWRKNLIPRLHVQGNKAERQSLSFDTTYRARETPKIYNRMRFENQGSGRVWRNTQRVGGGGNLHER